MKQAVDGDMMTILHPYSLMTIQLLPIISCKLISERVAVKPT